MTANDHCPKSNIAGRVLRVSCGAGLAGTNGSGVDICPLVILAHDGMAPIPKAKTAKALGVDLVLSTTRGFVTHAGVDDARRAELEAGMMKAMEHSMYQAYLKNSGLDETSRQPSGPWGEQIMMMVQEFGPALKEMGLVE